MKILSNLKTSLAAAAMLGAAMLGAGANIAHADAIDDITKAGVLNVGIFSDFPPFSSASADMSLKGYDIDVAQALADALKVKLVPVR
jgi:polar amino acid transport system substrate-binding protein